MPRIKITYATLRADNEELHALYEAGLEKARSRLGAYHRNYVDGAGRDGDGTFEVRSPIDSDTVMGTFAKGTRKDVHDAMLRQGPRAAGLGPPSAGSSALEIMKPGRAELISERQMD